MLNMFKHVTPLFAALYLWDESKIYMLHMLNYHFKGTLNSFSKISGVTCVACRF